MISLFLLIFAFQNGLATEDADLRQMVNSLQLTVNEMNGKVMHLENEVKVRVVLVNKTEHTGGTFIWDVLPVRDYL